MPQSLYVRRKVIAPDRREVSEPDVFPGSAQMLFLEEDTITLIIRHLDTNRYMLQWDDGGSIEPFCESWMIRINNTQSEQDVDNKPATAPEPKSEGPRPPEPEAEE